MKNISLYDDIPIKEEYIQKHIKEYLNQQKKKSQKKHKKPLGWIILILIFLSIFIFCSIKLLIWNNDNKETSQKIEDISDNVTIIEQVDNENTEYIIEEETSDYWYFTKIPLIDVNIAELKQKNSDVIGWIKVNNTNINYPFVQTDNNDYYLNHSFDKKYNEAGWVFMDYRNQNNTTDKNTIIYAHSRLDKTMFGSLSKVLKKDWYENKDNHIIRISNETENTMWKIFSVYKIKEESYYITTNFSSDKQYQEFLNTLEERSIYNFNISLNSTDRILTLSTCYTEGVRTVVHAKLIKRTTKT